MKNFFLKQYNGSKVYMWVIVISLDVIIVLSIVFFWDIYELLKGLSPCVLSTLGLKCALCDGTQSLVHLFNGNFFLAIKSNLLVILIILFFIVSIVLLNVTVFFSCNIFRMILIRMYSLQALWVYLIIAGVFMLMRNAVLFI